MRTLPIYCVHQQAIFGWKTSFHIWSHSFDGFPRAKHILKSINLCSTLSTIWNFKQTIILPNNPNQRNTANIANMEIYGSNETVVKSRKWMTGSTKPFFVQVMGYHHLNVFSRIPRYNYHCRTRLWMIFAAVRSVYERFKTPIAVMQETPQLFSDSEAMKCSSCHQACRNSTGAEFHEPWVQRKVCSWWYWYLRKHG